MCSVHQVVCSITREVQIESSDDNKSVIMAMLITMTLLGGESISFMNVFV